jgi:hypothetical protein
VIVAAVNPGWIEAGRLGSDKGALEWAIVAGSGLLAMIAPALGTQQAMRRRRSADPPAAAI